MKFALHYNGKLKSTDRAKGKHEIRKALHLQMKGICESSPFDKVMEMNEKDVIKGKGSPLYFDHGRKRFRFLVSEYLKTVVDLNITLLLPHPVGAIVSNGGDIDNRIKTLFDALRVPASADEIPTNDDFDYSNGGMYCLLQDDKLIESVSISAYQDHAATDEKAAKAIIQVNTRITAGLWGNLNFV